MTTLRRLSGRRRARRDAGRFVVDGPTLVLEALDAGADVVEVYVEPTAAPGPAGAVADAARRAGVPVVAVREGVLAQVTDPVTPQGVAAVVALPAPPPDDVLRGLVLVLVDVGDPGNAGTLVRVAEAAGASAVVFAGDVVDPWNPKCVRASAGSLFRVPVAEVADPVDLLDRLGAAGVTCLATTLDETAPSLDDVDLTGDVAVLLGSEAHGLRPELVAAAHVAVRIPMAGRVESLNVAAAGTVVAFEAARQRRVGRGA